MFGGLYGGRAAKPKRSEAEKAEEQRKAEALVDSLCTAYCSQPALIAAAEAALGVALLRGDRGAMLPRERVDTARRKDARLHGVQGEGAHSHEHHDGKHGDDGSA